MAIALVDVMGVVGLLIAAPVAIAIQVMINTWFLATATTSPTSTASDTQSFFDKMSALQQRISIDDGEITPRTRNLYERLAQLADDAKAAERA